MGTVKPVLMCLFVVSIVGSLNTDILAETEGDRLNLSSSTPPSTLLSGERSRAKLFDGERDELRKRFDGNPCGYENLCWCSGDRADCSRNAGKLTFIPKLPKGADFLNFSHNAVKEIKNYTFFKNVTKLIGLNMDGNGLTHIVPDAFRLLTRLKYLSLSYNDQLNNSVLPAALSTTSLTRLDITNSDLGPLEDDIFYRHPMPNLITLNLHKNHLKHLNLSVFVPLVRLGLLGIFGNQINDVRPGHLTTLDTLDLGLNDLQDLPDTCTKDGKPLYPKLTRLLLSDNRLRNVRADVCLPKLTLLDLNKNYIFSFEETTLNVHRFPALTGLLLERMHITVRSINRSAFRNPRLRRISLMTNRINFANDNFDPRCFAGCPSLSSLQLSQNHFERVTEDKWNLLFANLSGLQRLYIEQAYVTEIPLSFSKLVSLRELTLSMNSIAKIPVGVFDSQPNLTVIRLNNNQISSIQENTFSASTRHRLKHLDLSGNPFTCSCNVMWFRDWLLYDPKLFKSSWSLYRCDNAAKTKLIMFNMTEQACLMSHDTYVFLSVSLSLFISVFTLLSLLYRYRWHIRLIMYEAFRGRGRDVRMHRLQQHDFLYDIFVSYAAEDLPWVRKHLIPALEEGMGLRLCLHQRDFILGKPIVDNIEESLQSSKKVLMLFSTHFARSQWCQFELTLSLSHVMDHEDTLLVVLLHDIPPHVLTSAMMAVLRTTTYIEWNEHPDAVASFWGRMQIALQEILPAAGGPRY